MYDILVYRDPEIMGGTLLFTDTLVPVKNMIDYVKQGRSLGEFLADFPSVRRWHAAPTWGVLKRWLDLGLRTG
jgi:uncharacterized protein (DUF433 family)